MVDFDHELRNTVNKLKRTRANGGNHLPLEPETIAPPPTEYEFVKFGEKVAECLERAAEDQLTLAQNHLEQTRAFAANLRAQVADKTRELADMNSRLKAFGETVLNAHLKFNGEQEKQRTELPQITHETYGPNEPV